MAYPPTLPWKYLFGALLLTLTAGLSAQPQRYAFAQLDSLQRSEPRPVLVFIHTDWCRYCQGMTQTTLRDEAVVEALNERVYFIALDAEQQEPIRYAGQTFRYQSNGSENGVHQLALTLGRTEGHLTYPTLCLLSPAQQILFRRNGFLRAEELLALLDAW